MSTEIPIISLSLLEAEEKNYGEKVLLEILDDNKDTDYGRRYHFADLKTAEAYRNCVPLATSAVYKPMLRLICRLGERDILGKGSLEFFDPESVESGDPQFLPVTEKQLKVYYRVVRAALLRKELGRGSIYAMPPGKLDNKNIDAERIRALQNSIVRHIPEKDLKRICIPHALLLPKSLFDLHYPSILFALLTVDVSSIIAPFERNVQSVIKFFRENRAALADDIEQGTISAELPPDVRRELKYLLTPNLLRAAYLRLVNCADTDENSDYKILRQIWPRFETLCYVGTGNIEFHHIEGARPSRFIFLPYSGFYEFLPPDSDKTVTFNELEHGKEYELVVTNYAGYYRYRSGKIVRTAS